MKDLYFVEMDSNLGGFYTLGAYSTLEKAKDRIASIAFLKTGVSARLKDENNIMKGGCRYRYFCNNVAYDKSMLDQYYIDENNIFTVVGTARVIDHGQGLRMYIVDPTPDLRQVFYIRKSHIDEDIKFI